VSLIKCRLLTPLQWASDTTHSIQAYQLHPCTIAYKAWMETRAGQNSERSPLLPTSATGPLIISGRNWKQKATRGHVLDQRQLSSKVVPVAACGTADRCMAGRQTAVSYCWW